MAFGSLSSTRGGDEEDRTPDPLRARQVLSQLSYTPVFNKVPLAESLSSQTFKIEQYLKLELLSSLERR